MGQYFAVRIPSDASGTGPALGCNRDNFIDYDTLFTDSVDRGDYPDGGCGVGHGQRLVRPGGAWITERSACAFRDGGFEPVVCGGDGVYCADDSRNSALQNRGAS